MKMNIFCLIIFSIVIGQIFSYQQQYAYTIHYVKSYRPDLIQKNVGCKNNNIIYGTYIYPKGTIDALYLILNPGTYNMGRICNTNRNIYAKLFGTAQNYQQILKSDPNSVADQVTRSMNGQFNKFIVDWKYSPQKDFDLSRNWLNKFLQALQRSNQVYVKAPASYFCYKKNGVKYLLDLDKPKRLIIEMYGQQPGFYTTFEQIIQKQSSRPFKNQQNYPDNNCPKYPSYLTLSKNFGPKQFFIQKTLQQQQAGYIGDRFESVLLKAEILYGKMAFLDSYSQQIIQL